MTPAKSREVDRILDRIAYRALTPLGSFVCAYYALLALLHSQILGPDGAAVMVPMSGSVALFAGVVVLLARARKLPERSAHLAVVAIATMILTDNSVELDLHQDIKQTSNFALTIIGVGLILLSRSWLLFCLASNWVAWFFVGGVHYGNSDWNHAVFLMAGSTLVALLANHMRLGSIRDLEGMRLVVQEMAKVREAQDKQLELERRLEQSQRLESLGVMAGGIAHDFGNLLVPVLGGAEAALAEDPPEEVRLYLEQIVLGARRASDLTKQMLAYSGGEIVQPQPFDLDETIRGMAPLLHASISKKASLSYQLDSGPLLAFGDPGQARQVLLNLVVNASEALEGRDGTIEVRTERAEAAPQHAAVNYLPADAEASRLALRVADTGVGFSEEQQSRAFDPFFSSKSPGRGLGLATVAGIARRHNTAIEIETTPGQGSLISFLWPVRKRRAAPAHPNHQTIDADWRGDGLVLIVDDEAPVRLLLNSLLRKWGFDTVQATDGIEAVELFRDRPDDIRLILLDLTMPHMDGHEALARIREIRPNVPVILASGYTEKETDLSQMDDRRLARLRKPFHMEQLRETVAVMLSTEERAAGAAD